MINSQEIKPSPFSLLYGVTRNSIESPFIRTISEGCARNESASRFLSDLGITLAVNCDSQAAWTLKEQPAMLIINHPTGFMHYILQASLFALNNLRECTMIKNLQPLGLDPSLRHNCVEVAPKFKWNTPHGALRRLLSGSLIVSDEQRIEFNKNQLMSAAAILKTDKLLAIAPDGGTTKETWGQGIGKILHVLDFKPSIVFFHVQGLGLLDIYERSLRKALGLECPKQIVNVEIRSVEFDWTSELDPREITRTLQELYEGTFKEISPSDIIHSNTL